MRVVLTVFLILLGSGTVFATPSSSDLRDAYSAYQAAAEAGDLHGALPHAQTAYEVALELYGPENRNTGLLALNYGQLLFDLADMSNAIGPLEVCVEALSHTTNDGIELARAGLLLSQALAADRQWARAWSSNSQARGRLSSSSLSVSEEHLALLLTAVSIGTWEHYHGAPSRDHFRRRVFIPGPVTRNTLDRDRRRGHVHAHGGELTDLRRSQTYMERADQMVARLGTVSPDLLGQYYLAKGQVLMWERKYEEAMPELERAVEQLQSLDFTSDQLVTAMAEQIYAAQTLHDTSDLETMIINAFEVAHRRCDGGAVLIYHELPIFGNLMAAWGWVDFEFAIGPDGRATDLEVTDRFISNSEPSATTLEGYVFAPAMRQCQPTPVTGAVVKFRFEY